MDEELDFAAMREHRKQQGERLRQLSPNGGGGGGGGNKPLAWVQRMQYFSPTKTPTRMRLVSFTQENLWYRYESRWTKVTVDGQQLSRNIISNSHNGEIDIPCVLYHYACELEKPDLMASPSDAVTVVVLEDFHKVEKGKGKTGKAYYDLVRCQGKNRFGVSVCDMCKNKAEKVFGKQLHWSFWPNARKQFEEELAALPMRCASCFKGELSVFGYKCCKCDKEIANHYNGKIDPKHEETLRSKEISCPHCDHTANAVHMLECVEKHGEGDQAVYKPGCKSPFLAPPAAKPWLYDITVIEETVGTASAVRILEFSPQCDDFGDDRKLDPNLLRPLDFDAFFGQMSLDEQAKQMNRQNPFGAKGQTLVDEYFANKRKAAGSNIAASPGAADRNSIPWANKPA